ncbi:recombinase family protein [Microbacterium sp. NPDC016588]
MTENNTCKAFGYARVSTTSQTNDRQVDALIERGIDPDDIFTDKISGARQSRPGLDALKTHLRAGDSLTVHSFDRLGRTALHVFQTLAELEERGVTVFSLKGSEAQFSGATGKFLRDVLILVAELERSMTAERVAEARAAKAARAQDGEQIAGRPRTAMTDANVREVRKLKAKGRSVAEIVKLTGISRASVYRALSN